MKKYIAVAIALALMLSITGSVLASSLGISPSSIKMDVPATDSTTVDFNVHYFSGDVEVNLEDIPLRVEPETISVNALDEPEQIEVTIFGDSSLGSQVYDGYIIFRGISGGMIAVAVKVKAEVSNIVEGQPVPARQETGIDDTEKPTSGSNASTEYNSLSRNTIIILLAAAIVLIGLLLVAISLRRR